MGTSAETALVDRSSRQSTSVWVDIGLDSDIVSLLVHLSLLLPLNGSTYPITAITPTGSCACRCDQRIAVTSTIQSTTPSSFVRLKRLSLGDRSLMLSRHLDDLASHLYQYHTLQGEPTTPRPHPNPDPVCAYTRYTGVQTFKESWSFSSNTLDTQHSQYECRSSIRQSFGIGSGSLRSPYNIHSDCTSTTIIVDRHAAPTIFSPPTYISISRINPVVLGSRSSRNFIQSTATYTSSSQCGAPGCPDCCDR